MDINAYPTGHLHLGDTCIRVYNSFPIQYLEAQHRFHPEFIAQSLCYSHPLSYPYTWYVDGDQAAIVNYNDLLEYETGLPSVPCFPVFIHQRYVESPYESIDEVAILDDLNNDLINESFEQAASHVTWSGLTKRVISKNLPLTKYRQEEEEKEICVVCQDEFRSNERLGVLLCEHRYHPRCIIEWLVRQNVCPICKGQGLSVISFC